MSGAGTGRSVIQRIAHAASWRASALRGRIQARRSYVGPILRELRVTSGRSTVDLAGALFYAWRRHGIDPRAFARLMLWDVPPERWAEYIFGTELSRFLAKTLDPQDRALSRDKVAFAEHHSERGIAWPPTLAVIHRPKLEPPAGAEVVEAKEDLWPVLTRLSRDRDIVLKPACGERGRGFFHVGRSGVLRDSIGRPVTRDQISAAVFGYRHRLGDFGYFAQPALAPDPATVELTGVDALVTARLVTAIQNGAPIVLESFVKIPGPGSLTDNFLRGVTGSVMAGFDPETGRLTDVVGLLRPGHRFALEHAAVHPVTGRRIQGAELPAWRAAVELACRAALLHPRTATLGWDVALAASGCVLLDANPNWGSGRQLCWREGIRPRLAGMFSEAIRDKPAESSRPI